MELLYELWPFDVGHQQLIFDFSCAVVVGLILLNIFSALRQGLPIKKVFSGLFVEISTHSRVEKNLRILLIIFLVAGFLTLLIDTQINGMQLVNLNDIHK